MKKFIQLGCLLLTMGIVLTGCGSSKQTNLSYKASEVLDKIYEGVSTEKIPVSLATHEVSDDMVSYTIGTDKIDYKEIYESGPMAGSTAYSVVVVKLNEGQDVEEAKKLIKENVNPRKWICVTADIVTVDNVGDTILLIMMDQEREDLAKALQQNFLNLK